MITKNEEKLLEKSIASVKSIVDEIIIVDTGSKDHTKEIARKFTNKVFGFKFKDDFSEVRNFCISKATKKWILVLDADERINEKDLVKIKKLVKNKRYLGYRFIQKTKIKDKEYVRGICRLFQNNKGIRFVYPIHETVKNSIKELKGRIGSSGVVIEHLFRYNKDKKKLYFKLIKKKIKRFPDSNVLKEYEIEKNIVRDIMI